MEPKRIICDGCKDKKPFEDHTCYYGYSVINGERTTFLCNCSVCIQRDPVASSLAGELEHAFNQIGFSMMSDDFAGKLLAFTFHFNTELVVLHKGLNAGVMIAQEKANLKGGCVPDTYLVGLFNKRRRELEAAEQAYRMVKQENRTEAEFYLQYVPWLQEIYDRYSLANYHSVKKIKEHAKED